MRLKRARIRNFRSIRDLTINFGDQTAILGGNGTGKSSILRAIDRFYGSSNSLERDDFYGRDASEPVDIELTFDRFSPIEREAFAARIYGGEMTVARVFSFGRSSGAYYGSTLRHERFDQIRGLEQANPRRAAYSELRQIGGIYADLPNATSAAQVDAAMAAWEAAHPAELSMGRDDGKFFGFTNVARGALQRSTSFVFIPAVREASADALDGKNSAVGRLMELVVRSAIMQRNEVREWQARITDEFRALTSAERLPELGNLADALSAGLQHFYAEAGVGLAWREVPEFAIPLPNADVNLTDDGFASPVDRQGHGLQRAFILALLRQLSSITATDVDDSTAVDVTPEAAEASIEARLAAQVPNLILAIEEPELYQHPTKQRHFANVLSALSQGILPGSTGNTQVIFASHSPMFVSMARFHEIVLTRRRRIDGDGPKECYVTSSTLDAVALRLEQAFQKPLGTFTAATLAPRLHVLGPELAEGFFANCVVLVEGVDDRAALIGAAKLSGVDFEALGIAILSASGKNNLDRPAAIFLGLGIPCFMMWDCDGVESAQNAAFPRLLDPATALDAKPVTTVGTTFACFTHNLETTLSEEIGADAFERYLATAREEYDLASRADAIKSPAVMSRVLQLAADDDRICTALKAIVEAIVALRG